MFLLLISISFIFCICQYLFFKRRRWHLPPRSSRWHNHILAIVVNSLLVFPNTWWWRWWMTSKVISFWATRPVCVYYRIRYWNYCRNWIFSWSWLGIITICWRNRWCKVSRNRFNNVWRWKNASVYSSRWCDSCTGRRWIGDRCYGNFFLQAADSIIRFVVRCVKWIRASGTSYIWTDRSRATRRCGWPIASRTVRIETAIKLI